MYSFEQTQNCPLLNDHTYDQDCQGMSDNLQLKKIARKIKQKTDCDSM